MKRNKKSHMQKIKAVSIYESSTLLRKSVGVFLKLKKLIELQFDKLTKNVCKKQLVLYC